jgi:hypothetical protein
MTNIGSPSIKHSHMLHKLERKRLNTRSGGVAGSDANT